MYIHDLIIFAPHRPILQCRPMHLTRCMNIVLVHSTLLEQLEKCYRKNKSTGNYSENLYECNR